jgi:hypothetical protein
MKIVDRKLGYLSIARGFPPPSMTRNLGKLTGLLMIFFIRYFHQEISSYISCLEVKDYRVGR